MPLREGYPATGSRTGFRRSLPRKRASRIANVMSSIPESVTKQILTSAPAANADELDELPRPDIEAFTETGSGWDAYDVWRRFIKEARDRRESGDPSTR